MPSDAKIIMLLLSLAVLAAGCTSQLPTFGIDVVSVTREINVEGDRDVLVVKDKLTIPKSPVLTDQGVHFSFLLENKDVAKKTASVDIDLFDAPLMKNEKGGRKLCNQVGADGKERRGCYANECVPEQNSNRCIMRDILPGEQRQVTFDLFSPSVNEIGGIKTDIKMNFKVTYNFEGSTSFTVPVVDADEIKARQRAGDKIKVDIRKSIGSGPIQVDPELFGSPYILAEQSGTFFFVVKNKGKGNLPQSQIPKDGLCIYFPKDFFGSGTSLVTPDSKECTLSNLDSECKPAKKAEEGSQQTAGDAFNGGVAGGQADYSSSTGEVVSEYINELAGVGNAPLITGYAAVEGSGSAAEGGGVAESEQGNPLFRCVSVENAVAGCHDKSAEVRNTVLCYNVRPVELFKDESRVSMRFSFHRVKEIDEPFRSMTILTKIKYPYELRDSFSITAIPAKE
ncbi:MAG: hypothetical protein HY368_01460 [Candidatus Aenigmarchaeota archaeon]|nr:hypothetical protein [Candidatus Aenigmarchaeota archaeon]